MNRWATIAAACALLAAPTAFAQTQTTLQPQAQQPQTQQVTGLGKHDTSAPISVSADTFLGDFNTKVGTYSGNVVVTQGTFKLRADKVKVGVKDGQADRIEANGHVLFDSPSGRASGDLGVYELAPRTITFTGNVVLAKEKNVMRGTKLVVNLGTGQAALTAQGMQGGRVQSLFVPQKSKDGGK